MSGILMLLPSLSGQSDKMSIISFFFFHSYTVYIFKPGRNGHFASIMMEVALKCLTTLVFINWEVLKKVVHLTCSN